MNSLKTLTLVASVALTLLVPSANAERESAVGVGVQGLLAAPGTLFGPTLVYQSSSFHIEGILAFSDIGNQTDLGLAGRFWYAVHQTDRSDFSVGGGLGFLIDDQGNTNDLNIEIDLGAQLRAFIVPNVSLNASLGFVVVTNDGANTIAATGGLLATTGITYFFSE